MPKRKHRGDCVTAPNFKDSRSTSATLRSGEPGIDPTSQNTSELPQQKNIEDDMMTPTENTTNKTPITSNFEAY